MASLSAARGPQSEAAARRLWRRPRPSSSAPRAQHHLATPAASAPGPRNRANTIATTPSAAAGDATSANSRLAARRARGGPVPALLTVDRARQHPRTGPGRSESRCGELAEEARGVCEQRGPQDRPKRSLPLWKWEEVQALLRRVTLGRQTGAPRSGAVYAKSRPASACRSAAAPARRFSGGATKAPVPSCEWVGGAVAGPFVERPCRWKALVSGARQPPPRRGRAHPPSRRRRAG